MIEVDMSMPMSPGGESNEVRRHRKKKSRHRDEVNGENIEHDGVDGSDRRHRRRRSKRTENGEMSPDGEVEEGERRRHKRRHKRGNETPQEEFGNMVISTEYALDNPIPEPQYDFHGGNIHVEEVPNYPSYEWETPDRRDGDNYSSHSGEDVEHIGGDNEENYFQGTSAIEDSVGIQGELDVNTGLDKKKKSGGLGKIFSSIRKKNKRAPESEVNVHENWESNPGLFMPNVESQVGTLEPHEDLPMAPSKTKKKATKPIRTPPSHETNIVLLDGDQLTFAADKKFSGSDILRRVCDELNIVEIDYFGLTWTSNKLKTWFWLDMDKKISKQLRHGEPWLFYFQVKFYPPEPSLVQEDITRYQLCLQLRHDVYTGKLPCSWVTHALLGSYMVQSEIGDYIPQKYEPEGLNYIREFEFYHKQTDELLMKIVELHKTLVGMTPEQADIKYMETAKRLEHYGVDLHPAWDSDNVQIFVGVSFYGIFVYKDRIRLSRFAWPKILRISYKKNFFYLKIRSDIHDNVEGVIGFRLLTHHFAKRLWKNAIEHHTFFRLKETKFANGRGNKMVSSLTLGSKYRFSGRTFFQHRTMSIERPHPSFDRTVSKRFTISMPMGMNQGGAQFGSAFSLHRAHPRDMSVGKTKSVEYLGPRQLDSEAPGTIRREKNQTPDRSGRQVEGQSSVTPLSSRRGPGSVSGSQYDSYGRPQPVEQQSDYEPSVSGTVNTNERYRGESKGGLFSPPQTQPRGRSGRPNNNGNAYVADPYVIRETTYANVSDYSTEGRYQHTDEYSDEML